MSKGPFTSIFSNGYLTSIDVADNSITSKNPAITGWNMINGTGTSYYAGSGTTSLYSGGPLPGVSNRYIISVNGDPSGGALPTGNVQTMSQVYKFPAAGTYNLVFYVFAGSVIDPYGTHSVSVYVGGQPILYNYSVGKVPNTVPQVVTLPFTVDVSNLTLNVGFVFYCANANPSYLGITGITYFNQTTAPYSFLASDPSGLRMYLPLQTDYLNYATGSVNTEGTNVVMNGGGKVLPWADVSSSATPLARGLGYLSLLSASQQYLGLTGNTISLPVWESTALSGATLAGWFYGLGATQAANATLISMTGTGGLSMSLRYYQHNPLLIFTADPARVVCGVPMYTILPQTWNHVAVVIGTNRTDTTAIASQTPYRFYLNGVLMATAYGPWPNGDYTEQTVGYDTGAGVIGSVGGGYFNGYVDDVRVYTRALTENDLRVLSTLPVHVTSTMSIVDTNAMVMYFPMDRCAVIYSYGILNTLALTNGALTGGATVTGWTAAGIVGAATIIGKTSTAGIYMYGLPSTLVSSTFVVAMNPVGSSVQWTQNISFLLGTPTKCVLGFYVFPSDGAYQSTQTLTVSVGSQVLLNRVGFSVSASTVPHTAFTLPFTLSAVGQYPITFTFSRPAIGSGNSSLCLAGVQVTVANTVNGVGATDPSNLTLYYPLDTSTVVGGKYLQNYATGTGIQDASMVNASMVVDISGSSGQVGSGCLALSAGANQYAVLGFMIPSVAAVGAGVSFTGWFQATGSTQVANASLFSFANATGTYRIQCFYQANNNWLDFSANPGVEYVAWSYRIVPGVWYFLTYVLQSNNASGTSITHTYYLNDVCMNSTTVTGTTWPGTFTNNVLGYGSGLGYFNGYIDDFRVYRRALTGQDVFSLWTYGYNRMFPASPGVSATAGVLIDPSGLQIYYPFNQGTMIYSIVPSVTMLAYTGLTFDSVTVNFTGPTTYYYVAVGRNTVASPNGVTVKQAVAVTSYMSTGMTADISYTFTLVPYDDFDVSYVPVITTPISPLARVTSATYVLVDIGQISFGYQSATSYLYTTIARSNNGDVQGTAVKQPEKATLYTDYYTSFSPTQYYNYTIVPYNALDVSGTPYVTQNVSPLATVTFGYYTIGTTTINVRVNDPTTFSYVTMTQNTNGVTGSATNLGVGVREKLYSELSAYNAYTYRVVPYNVLDGSNTALVTPATSPIPDVSFTGFTDVSFVRLSVTFASTYTATQSSRSFYNVTMARTVNNVTAPAFTSAYTIVPTLTDASYLDMNVTANNSYTYHIIPYNAISVSGGVVSTTTVSPVADVSFLSYSGITTTSINLNYGTVSGGYISYYDVSVSRMGNGGGMIGPGDISYTDAALTPNTLYSWNLRAYNRLYGAGRLTTSRYIYTLPRVGGTTISSVGGNPLITLVNDGSFATVDVSRVGLISGGGGSRSLMLKRGLAAGETYLDTSAVINEHYLYYVTPYNANMGSDPSAGATIYTAYQFILVTNGFFTSPALATDTSLSEPASLNGWTIGFANGMNYAVANGRAGYTGTLPAYYTGLLYATGSAIPTNVTMTATTQYLWITNRPMTATVGTTQNKLVMSQAMGVPSPGNYYLVCYLLPGVTIDSTHLLTIMLDGRVILYNYSLGATVTTTGSKVPVPLNLPFVVVAGSLTFTMSFTFTSPATSTVGSAIGITGIGCYSATAASYAVSAIDPSALIVYYPMNLDASNYATSLAVQDATLSGTAALLASSSGLAINPLISNHGYLSLSNSNSYLTIAKTVVIPTWTAGGGFSLMGWFNSTMITPNNNAPLISLTDSVGGATLILKYNQTNPSIIFTSTVGGTTITCGVGNNNVYPNMWNHIAVVVAPGTSATSSVFRLYLNGYLLSIVTGVWPAGSYTSNYIGYDAASSAYFNGYVDDVRVYGRSLSEGEITALCSSNTSNAVYSLIDPGELVMYYPFDSGSFIPIYGTLTTISLTNGNFSGGTSGWTVEGYGSATTSVGYGYGLPSRVGGTYLVVQSPAGAVSTVSQNVTFLTTLVPTKYVLSFYAFPCDGAYGMGQILSVAIGNLVLLNGVALSVSATTVPYTTFTLQFSFAGGGNYPLVFTVMNRGSTASNMGITGVTISVVSAGSGYTAIDTSNLTLYYPLDMDAGNYTTGTVVNDSSGGANVVALSAGTSQSLALTLSATTNQYMTMGSWLPPLAAMGAGISVTAWFYVPIGISQASNAVLFSLANGVGARIKCVYNTLYGCLDFSANCTPSTGQDYVTWSYPLIPGAWYFLAYTLLATNATGTAVTHTYYLNNVCMNTVVTGTGSWIWPTGAFTTNTLGTELAGGSFTGYVDDFRVYRRALSSVDVAALWAYGYNAMMGGLTSGSNVVDPSGLQIYYPFNQGTGVMRSIPSVTISPVYATVFTGITATGCTINYGPATAYYYVKTTRKIFDQTDTIGTATVTQPVGATSNVVTGLVPDTSYTFTIVPYDETNTESMANAVTTVAFSPTPGVVFGSYTLGTTSIALNFTATARYVMVSQNVNGTGFGAAVTAPIGAFSYLYSGSSAASVYNFRIVPYNAVDISGTSVDTASTSPFPDVSFGGYVDISFTRLSVLFNSTYTSTATARSYYDVSMARTVNTITPPALSAYTIMPAISDTSYIDTTVTANNYYNYFIVPYNAVYVSGTMVPTTSISPTAQVTFGGYTLGKTTVQLTYGSTTSLSYVTLEQSTDGGTSFVGLVAPGIGVLSYIYSGLTPSIAYMYRVTPYNAILSVGTAVTTTATSPIPDVSFMSFANVTTTGFKMNYGSISGGYMSYSYVSTARSVNGGATAVAVNRSVGDVSFVETGLLPNTMYSYALVPYNAVAVAGTTTASWNIYTLPLISYVMPSVSGATSIALTLPMDGSYSFYDVSRSDGGVGMSILVTKAAASNGTCVDISNVVSNTHYMYYVTPYTVSYVSNPSLVSAYSVGATMTTGYLVQPVVNGYFTSTDMVVGTISAMNPVVSGWTVTAIYGYGSAVPKYYVGDGSVVGYYTPTGTVAYYTGYMPNVVQTMASQYLLLGSSPNAAVAVTQTITVPSAGMYYLTWYAFAGASKTVDHSLSVSIGGANVMYGILEGSTATNTMPVSYTVPWLASAENRSITLRFTGSVASTIDSMSYIGFTGVTCFSAATNSLGLMVVDASALAIYCPLNTDIYEYSTGAVVTTSTVGSNVGGIVQAATVGVMALPVGQGCLALNGTSHSLKIPSVTIVAGGSGLSVAVWFYGSGATQSMNATLISLHGALAVCYSGVTANLAVRVFGSSVGITTRTVVPNTWNHLSVVVGSNGTTVVWLNGRMQSMSTVLGAYTWVTQPVTYTDNLVGYSTWSAYTAGYFKGYISDVRVYTRALLDVEVGALWNFGEANVAHSLIDPMGMVMYYPENQGMIV